MTLDVRESLCRCLHELSLVDGLVNCCFQAFNFRSALPIGLTAVREINQGLEGQNPSVRDYRIHPSKWHSSKRPNSGSHEVSCPPRA